MVSSLARMITWMPDRRGLATALGIAVLVLAVHVFARRQGGFLSVQGRTNLWFVAHPSLAVALEEHPKVRPPLYPVLLWLASRAGIRPALANEILFDATLLALLAAARRVAPDVPPLAPTALFAVLNFNYANLYQCTAEILFVPLGLALYLLLERHGRTRRPLDLWLAGLVTAALCATRSFALFFAAPVLAAAGLLFATGGWRARAWRVAGPLALALAPAALWMGLAYAETGYLTGADRSAERRLPRQVRHWTELRGFRPTLLLTAKTLWIDFLSPDVHASLAIVTRDYEPAPVEYAGAGLVAIAGVLAGVATARAARQGQVRAREAAARPAVLLAAFLAAYLLVTLALWTFGNNDPIYTRFLFPSYPFLVLLGFAGYALVRRTWTETLCRAPFWALYVLLAALHLTRDWLATPVPFR